MLPVLQLMDNWHWFLVSLLMILLTIPVTLGLNQLVWQSVLWLMSIQLLFYPFQPACVSSIWRRESGDYKPSQKIYCILCNDSFLSALCSAFNIPTNGREIMINGFSINDTASYSCDSGFEAEGSGLATCTYVNESIALFLPRPTCIRKLICIHHYSVALFVINN